MKIIDKLKVWIYIKLKNHYSGKYVETIESRNIYNVSGAITTWDDGNKRTVHDFMVIELCTPITTCYKSFEPHPKYLKYKSLISNIVTKYKIEKYNKEYGKFHAESLSLAAGTIGGNLVNSEMRMYSNSNR